MTFDEAKDRLDQRILDMENGNPFLTYAAIVVDSEDSSNYLLEYGLTTFEGPYITRDKVLDVNQKGTFRIDNKVIISEDGSPINREIYNKTNTPFGNLLAADIKLKEKIRPLKAGTSIADSSSKKKSGTIGALFTVEGDEDHTYLLSNMHVLSYYKEPKNRIQTSQEHDIIVQPSRSDAADLKMYDEGDRIGKTVWKVFDGVIDAAVARIDPDIPVIKGFFNGNHKCQHYFESSLKVGDPVYKYGRTTGYTESKIISLHAAIKVKNLYQDVNNLGEFIVFKDQIMTTNMAENGDSGSLLVSTNNQYPIGLTFSDINFTNTIGNNFMSFLKDNNKLGRTFHNKLDNIFTHLMTQRTGQTNNEQLIFKSFIT